MKNTPVIYNSADALYTNVLELVMQHGREQQSRGKLTSELLSVQAGMRMHQPVVSLAERKLSYRFMFREAEWILSGDNMLAPLAEILPHMEQFSDDGETLSGAYGPPLSEQLPYVIKKLESDEGTRQAVATIWRPRSPHAYGEELFKDSKNEPFRQNNYSTAFESKDVPCTVYLGFQVRPDWEMKEFYERYWGSFNPEESRVLHVYARMRSSDVFMGLPYDLFVFSYIGWYVCAVYNRFLRSEGIMPIKPGTLYWSADSAHVYAKGLHGSNQFESAASVLVNKGATRYYDPAPIKRLQQGKFGEIEETIAALARGEVAPHDWNPWPRNISGDSNA